MCLLLSWSSKVVITYTEFVNYHISLTGEDNSSERKTPEMGSGVLATLNYTMFESPDRINIDLGYFDIMKKSFFTKFVQMASKDKNLAGIVSLDEFLKNYEPFLRMICATSKTEIYDDYTDCFLLMKFISTIVHSNTQILKHHTFKLLKSTLRFHISNPIIYIYLVFCILDQNSINEFEYEQLHKISNTDLLDFLIKRLNDNSEKDAKNGGNSVGLETIYILSLFIQLVEDQYTTVVEMIKEVKTAKEREKAYQNQNKTMSSFEQQTPFNLKLALSSKGVVGTDKTSIASPELPHHTGLHLFIGQTSQTPNIRQFATMTKAVENTRSKEAEEVKSNNGDVSSRRRIYSVHISNEHTNDQADPRMDPLNQNGVLSEYSMTLSTTKEQEVVLYHSFSFPKSF